MSRLDPGARHILARDRMDRFRAEADAERAAATGRRDRAAVASWEGRPARQPASVRILALAGRALPVRRDREPVSR